MRALIERQACACVQTCRHFLLRVFVSVRACIRAVCTHIRRYVNVCMCVCMSMHVYVYVDACTCVEVCMYVTWGVCVHESGHCREERKIGGAGFLWSRARRRVFSAEEREEERG